VTGPEHYTAATRLAYDAQSVETAIHASQDDEQRAALHFQHLRISARAQVHATLALAAAAADALVPSVCFRPWEEVIR